MPNNKSTFFFAFQQIVPPKIVSIGCFEFILSGKSFFVVMDKTASDFR